MTFHDTVPTDLGGLTGPEVGHASTSNEPEQRLGIEFTASGSEYFRIWVVNLLLTIVTLTLYAPFARARRLTYFYANTRVGGHALGFHGNPWKMLRGHLLVMALAGAYALASNLSPTVAAAAVLLFALVWPALWRASLQFRLANTSWRGLRLGFDGGLAGAYTAMAPLLLPGVVLALAGVLVQTGQAPQPRGAALPGWLVALSLLPALLFPWAMARIKRYQHGGYTFASETTRLTAGTGAFYLWGLKLVALALPLVAAFGLMFLTMRSGLGRDPFFSFAVIVGLILLGYLALLLVGWPFAASRLQNLVWGHTASRRVRFASHLALWPLVGLTLKNFFLTAVTLGLYRPFAAVTQTRMRLQAVSLHVRGDLDEWVARATRRNADVAADAAGDFFGVDLGL